MNPHCLKIMSRIDIVAQIKNKLAEIEHTENVK